MQKTLQGHEHEVSSVAFLTQGDFLLSASRDNTIRMWDTITGYCVKTLKEGHTDWIRRVCVHHAGELFASASKDETIIVWSVPAIK